MESAKDVGKNVEVNKHQKALNNLIKNDYEYFDEETNSHLYDKDLRKLDINILQTLADKVPYYKELEDKATPKKVRREESCDNGVLYAHYEHCGNCEYTLYESTDRHFKYCPNCGQAIDWS